jgi:hypothetical protein
MLVMRQQNGEDFMKSRLVLVACGLALSAGCSGSPRNAPTDAQNGAAETNIAAAPAAPVAGPAGEERFQQLSECAATLGQMAVLYDAIADRERGSQHEEMAGRASARRSAAAAFELEAGTLGTSLGHNAADIDRIKTARRAIIERERSSQPDFGEFAIWLGREADRCAALVPPGG